VFARRAFDAALFLLDCRGPPRCTASTHGGDAGAADDAEWSATSGSFFTALSRDHGPPLAERKAGPVSTYVHRGPAWIWCR